MSDREMMREDLERIGHAKDVMQRSGIKTVFAEVLPKPEAGCEVHYHFHGNITIVAGGNSPEVYVGDAPVRVGEAKNGRKY